MIILVVEDESLINLMASDELQRAGHEIISAYSADEAIEILEGRDDIRLIFTDVDMPGSMDGIRLAAVVRNRWPPVRIIITSGMRRSEVAAMPEGSVFLAKPYRINKLLQAVASFG